MTKFYDITPLADLLDEVQKDGSGEVLRQISKRMADPKRAKMVDALQGYESFFAQLAGHIRHHGRLEDDDYTKLRLLFDEIQDQLKQATIVDFNTHTVDSHGVLTLKALHLLGGLEVNFNDFTAALFISPKMLTRAFSIASTLDTNSRWKHILAIANIREDSEAESNPVEAERRIQGIIEEIKACLVRLAKLDIPLSLPSEPIEGMIIEYLPTASDYYEAGIDYYAAPLGTGRRHYILATTSGILLPEDYYGSAFYETIFPVPSLAAESDKNPVRVSYFQALADVRGRPRWYFFEIERARAAYNQSLSKIIQKAGQSAAEHYRELSLQTISKFLQLPGFGLFGVTKFPRPFDHLTLGNGRHILISGRDKKERKHKIGHGLWIRPDEGEFKRLASALKNFEAKDIIAGLIAATAPFLTEQDPRLQLAEALFSGFAVPLFISLARKISQVEAEQAVLDIGLYVAQELEHSHLPYLRPPDSRPLSDHQALTEATRILSLLEAS